MMDGHTYGWIYIEHHEVISQEGCISAVLPYVWHLVLSLQSTLPTEQQQKTV